MLGLLMAMLAGVGTPLPLGELPPQTMAANSCAMFLWDRSSRQRIVMVTAEPASVRINSGGVRTLAQTAGAGDPVLGFRPNATYADADIRIDLALAITPNDAAVGGAVIRDGAMTVTGADGMAVVSPVAGLVGCQK